MVEYHPQVETLSFTWVDSIHTTNHGTISFTLPLHSCIDLSRTNVSRKLVYVIQRALGKFSFALNHPVSVECFCPLRSCSRSNVSLNTTVWLSSRWRANLMTYGRFEWSSNAVHNECIFVQMMVILFF